MATNKSNKPMFFVVVLGVLATSSAGVVPVPLAAAYVAPYASTYNAHVVNHAIAAPVAAPFAAPLVAAPAHYAYPHHGHFAHAYAAPAPFAYSEPLVVAK